MSLNYYETIINKANDFLKQKKFAKVVNLLIDELEAPYIPREYEGKIRNMYELALQSISILDKNEQFSVDQLISFLFQSKNKQSLALNLLHNYNLRPHQSILKKRIETFKSSASQAILFELMADQDIEVKILIKGKELIPTKDSIFGNQEVIKAYEAIKKDANLNPQIINLSLTELHTYLLLTFPKKEVDGIKLASNIVKVVDYMLYAQITLNAEQKMIYDLLKKLSTNTILI